MHVGNSNWPPCWPSTGRQKSHHRWISGNIHHICLCQLRIRLWNPEETSPNVQNRGISGLIKRHMSTKLWKNDFKNKGNAFTGYNTCFSKINNLGPKVSLRTEGWKPWNEKLKRTRQHQKRSVTLSESIRLPISDTLISVNIHGTAPKNLFSCVPI